MAIGGEKLASVLIVEELFAAADDRFLDTLRQPIDPKKFAPFATKWAREQVLHYLSLPLDRPGHQTIVKRLFKAAEQRGDDELMGAFAAAFDRLVRRVCKKRSRYDWQTRQSWTEEYLVSPRDVVKYGVAPWYRPPGGSAALYSYHTRYYLRRRAWRYFRRMGFQRAADYCAAVAGMLARYRDADLAKGENVLDSWSLLHACFASHPALAFDASRARLVEGRGLADLQPAPQHAKLWAAPTAAKPLLALVPAAASRLVRAWAIALLREQHAERLRTVAFADLLPLLDHAEADVQEFGAALLENAAGLEGVSIDDWLRLLRTRNPTALETIARVMHKHVRGDRLTLFDAVMLATAEPVPVARLGLSFLQDRPIVSPTDRQAISNLAGARCGGMGREIAAWALSILGATGQYNVEQVIRFFDALLPQVRAGAWEWLTESTPGWNDPVLWGRLLETPYEDVRLRLVAALDGRSTIPGAGPDDLAAVWVPVLLGIHRGGRRKLSALRQISQAVRADPSRAARLIPVLAIAIRSVRPPEARAGLAAVVGAVEAQPGLAEVVARHLPELDLRPAEVTA